jgi:hypothetical protein
MPSSQSLALSLRGHSHIVISALIPFDSCRFSHLLGTHLGRKHPGLQYVDKPYLKCFSSPFVTYFTRLNSINTQGATSPNGDAGNDGEELYLHLFWMGLDDHHSYSYRADIGLALCQVLSESVRLTSLDLWDVTGRHEFGGHSLEPEGLSYFARTWKVACSLCYHIPCFTSNEGA